MDPTLPSPEPARPRARGPGRALARGRPPSGRAAPEAEGHSCLAGYSLALRLREDQQLVAEKFVDVEDKRVAIFRDLLATVEYEESP